MAGRGADRLRRLAAGPPLCDVATDGPALRNAAICQLQSDGRQDRIGIDNWVRLFRYIVQTHGAELVSLTGLEPPAHIALAAHYVPCVHPGGAERRFAATDHGAASALMRPRSSGRLRTSPSTTLNWRRESTRA